MTHNALKTALDKRVSTAPGCHVNHLYQCNCRLVSSGREGREVLPEMILTRLRWRKGITCLTNYDMMLFKEKKATNYFLVADSNSSISCSQSALSQSVRHSLSKIL